MSNDRNRNMNISILGNQHSIYFQLICERDVWGKTRLQNTIILDSNAIEYGCDGYCAIYYDSNYICGQSLSFFSIALVIAT